MGLSKSMHTGAVTCARVCVCTCQHGPVCACLPAWTYAAELVHTRAPLQERRRLCQVIGGALGAATQGDDGHTAHEGNFGIHKPWNLPHDRSRANLLAEPPTDVWEYICQLQEHRHAGGPWLGSAFRPAELSTHLCAWTRSYGSERRVLCGTKQIPTLLSGGS